MSVCNGNCLPVVSIFRSGLFSVGLFCFATAATKAECSGSCAVNLSFLSSTSSRSVKSVPMDDSEMADGGSISPALWNSDGVRKPFLSAAFLF